MDLDLYPSKKRLAVDNSNHNTNTKFYIIYRGRNRTRKSEFIPCDVGKATARISSTAFCLGQRHYSPRD